MRSPSRTRRFASALAAAAVVALTLTGCLKVDADLSINADAQASGTLAMELQKEAAGFLGIASLDDFASQITQGDLADTGVSGLQSCQTSENDTGYVYTCTFTDQAFTEPDGPWTIAREGDQVVFRMVNEGQSEEEAADAAALLGDAQLGAITVNVTFPGPITEVTGTAAKKTSDTTATVTGSLTTPIDVTITSDASSGSSLATMLVLVVLGLVLILVVIVIVVLLSRRRRAPAGEPAADAAVVATAAGAAAAPVVLDDAGAPTEVVEAVDTVETAAVVETADGTATEVVETVETTDVTDAPADDQGTPAS